MAGFRLVWYSPSDCRRRRHDPVDPSGLLHRIYADHIWLSPFPYMRASALLSLTLWPLIVAVLSLRWTWRHGSGVRRKTGKSLRRQVREQFGVAFASSMLPLRYYQNEMFDDALRPRAGEYILLHELKTVLFGLIRMRLPPQGVDDLKNKDRFAAACRDCGLPHAVSVLAMRDGKVLLQEAATTSLPPRSLFVKPLIGRGGRRVMRWIYDDGERRWCNPTGEKLDELQLLERIAAASPAPGILVQELLVVEPGLADLTPGALITARIITQVNDAGGVEITAAVLRLPRSAEASADNVNRGGIAASIDLDSGRLGPAADYLQAAVWYDRHPTTGGTITGRVLPHWKRSRDLVQRAHALLAPERGCIGWDIGQCAGGPRIVEANVAPDLDFMQRPLRRPLGNDRVGQLLALHAARAARGEPPLRVLASAAGQGP